MSTLKQIKRKLNDSSAFTLAEALVAMLIMLMVSSIVAAGIPSAQRAYERVVLASNAEVLLSTTISTLRNELGTASDIEVTPSGTVENITYIITYINPRRNTYSSIYLKELSAKNPENPDFKTIFFRPYARVKRLGKDIGNDSDEERLIGEKASTDNLYVTYTSAAYNPSTNTVTFYGLSVNRESGETGLAERSSLSIQTVQ